MTDFNSLYRRITHLMPEEQGLLLAALSSTDQAKQDSTNTNMASTQPQHLHNDFSAEGSVSPSTDATAAHHVGFDDSLLFQPPAQDGANPLDAASLAHLGYADLDGYGDADNLDLSTGFMQSAETSGVAQDADFFDQQSEQRPSVSGSASDEQDGPEKRKSSVDAQEETDGKKPRASGTGKKPGRKPLTSEPTSKRKAQNRAAQRAFRERKEKHLKDLETKVEELEKASKTSTQENSLLKAQIVRLQTELKEYRKRLSWIGTNPIGPLGGQLNYRPVAPPYGGQRPAQPSNPDVSFQFPNLWQQYAANNQPASSKNPAIPGILDRNFLNSSSNTISTPGTPNANPAPISTTNAPDGITSYNAPQHNNVAPQISNRPAPSSTFTSPPPRSHRASNSPSSCGEPIPCNGSNASAESSTSASMDSPLPQEAEEKTQRKNSEERKKISSVTEFCQRLGGACGNKFNPIPADYNDIKKYYENGITEEEPSTHQDFDLAGFGGNQDTSHNLDWLVQQNSGAFDPVLFTDYRDPQDAFLQQDLDSFLNDTTFDLSHIDSATTAPAPAGLAPSAPASPALEEPPVKPDAGAAEDTKTVDGEVVPASQDRKDMLTCAHIWDRISKMERFQSGEIDIDNLCAELKAKARCSETGVVVDQAEVDKIVNKAMS